jgi:hypothetical protein
MKIEADKYYRTRGGKVVGPVVSVKSSHGPDYVFRADGIDYTKDGCQLNSDISRPLDLVAEVQIVPALGFELKAGCKYETVLETREGPVVELIDHESKNSLHDAYLKQFPFCADIRGTRYFVQNDGLILSNKISANWSGCRIVREQPKPTTHAEKLQSAISLLANPRKDDEAFALIRGVIADLKAEAKS